MSDFLADAVEPHCPNCDSVLHEHPRGWLCHGCKVEWPRELITPEE